MILSSLTTLCQTISKNGQKSDSVKCFTNSDMQVINGVFIDLDDCENEVIALGKIVSIQDTLLKSKVEIEELYRKQNDYNEELKYQLTASINTQIQRFNVLESAYKYQNRVQKKRSIITGTSMGIGLMLTFGIVIFQLLK